MKPPLRFTCCFISLLLVSLGQPVFAGDIGFYGVIKEQAFLQNGNVTPSFTNAHFECFVDSTAPNLINSASVQIPSGGSRTLVADGSDAYHFKDVFNSTSALNSVYGTGTYRLDIDSENDGFSFAQLSMPSDAYGSAPFITNYVAAQNIDPAADFTLYWSSFVGGTANDFIEVRIQDDLGNEVFSSLPPGSPGAPNGTSTSFMIPANSLAAGRQYDANVSFIKVAVFDTTQIPGSTGVVAFVTKTSFKIQTSGSAGQIKTYAVIKMQDFMQTNNGAPVFSTNEPPFAFQSFVNATATNVVTNATVQIPSSAIKNLAPEDQGKSWSFSEGFSSLSALNASYGNGLYTMSIATASTNYSIPLPMPLAQADTYPNTPQFTNYLAAQSINPSNDFVLYWTAFSGGTTNDYVQVEVRDGSDNAVFRSGEPGATNALNGTSTPSLSIPADTLLPGTTYNVQLLFAHPVTLDTTNIPGAIGFAAYVKKTAAQIHTTGTPPVVTLQALGFVNGHFQFKFNSIPGRNYQIQWSDTLPAWQNLWFTNATAPETVFTDTFGLNSQRFYRVQAQ